MKLTPRMLQFLVKRHKQEHQRQELLVGIVAANVVNFSMRGPERPEDRARPVDFMPSYWAQKRHNPEPTPEEVTESLRAAFSVFQ